ncbi:tetratricopeptide repeat protein [Chryseobacterium sp. CCH4-E10]|uniref:tetratricopeptide repeat protein n=1 Tax=Chryseobacterium sp. CCH4-E10 TaxID=1768758 RepID=UPI000832F183|nr:tetratricopeptide repeat protein [Chryseobacterium sp. CCH4-E10]
MKTTLLVILITSFHFCNAQKKTFKCEKVYDAVSLIDQSQFDEAITILEECEKVDPGDYTYPYEIAYALLGKKEYKSAIAKLEKIKNYPNIKSDYYQLLGNTYDYDNNPKKAIATYDEGLKKFPNSGRLYLEKGVIFESNKEYNAAIELYEQGIKAEPMYPSNYYRAANIFLSSDNKLSGLLYGEIFLNLERTTKRTQEMSKKIYDTYKASMSFKSDKSFEISICKSIKLYPEEKLKMSFCMMFEANLALAAVDQKEFSLNSFAEIRKKFLSLYNNKFKREYPSVLFEYFKKMEDNNVFNAYNFYIFQMGDQQAFTIWLNTHKEEYEKFVGWYTSQENIIELSAKTALVPHQ